ncbi:MAG: redoxin domain-containing protein [Planctomycetaceae bacterium]|nr:redoxin domain-containing protein [Planctomycetaceae bacterium]
MSSQSNPSDSAAAPVQPGTDSSATSSSSAGGGFGVFVLVIALVLCAGIGFSTLMKQGVKQQEGGAWHGGAQAGAELPPVEAAGWINSEGVSPEELKGNVVVLHGWFVDCPYCWREAPELVELHEKFSGQGVKFVGLTHESGEMIPRIEGFVEENKITWPQGYGALDTLLALNAEYFPVVWVVGRDGRIFWSTDGQGSLEEAIRLALAG